MEDIHIKYNSHIFRGDDMITLVYGFGGWNPKYNLE